jgi:hypothetical protein
MSSPPRSHRRLMRAGGLLGILALASLTCDDTAGRETGSGGADGGGGNQGPPPAPDCPDAPITDGTPCEPREPSPFPEFADRAHCTWGEDPRPFCRYRALCTADGTWTVSPPASYCSTSSLGPDCPASPGPQTACTLPAGKSCWYADGTRCGCTRCDASGPEDEICPAPEDPESPCNCLQLDEPVWSCGIPSCSPYPNAGTTCDASETGCSPMCSLQMRCVEGVWVWRWGECF